MTELDEDTLHYLTELCHIGCSKEEEESLLNDLQKILDFIETLDAIDTSNVEPTFHIFPEIVNVMREDEIGETMKREVFLDNAPSHVAGMIRVPPVLSQSS
ncbi:Asp-tRNA(Asn)/Glu-tRNA(Gln) amidotransferase subunit GatC [Chlamydiales bacterium]|nr:Asp-tRNA(Asn)/Glu-tRNA(Gln) amidotransferase subunit GatC [Chlamydiales bacterium]